MNCDFRAYDVCTNFRVGLLQRGRRTGVEPLNLVIIHIMQHHLSDILRCVVILYIVVQQMRCSVKCTIVDRAEKDVHSWRAVSLW